MSKMDQSGLPFANILHPGLCFSRLDCAQEVVQGKSQGEEVEEGEAVRGGLRGGLLEARE